MNILNTLSILKLDSKPFYPNEIKKEKKTEIKTLIETEIKPIESKLQQSETINEKDISNAMYKLKSININEIKEYVPKNYRLVSRDNTKLPYK